MGTTVRTAVYPGSFDPITNGHLDLIRRGAELFDRLVVAVASNNEKAAMFDIDERLAMIRDCVGGIDGAAIEVDTFDGLAVDYVRGKGARVILRGIRTLSDFEYEFQMALTNRTFAKDVETVFVMSSLEYSFLSSRLIKQAAAAGGDVSAFVPAHVEPLLKAKLAQRRE